LSGIKQETGNRTTEKAVKTFELIRTYTGKGYMYIYGTISIFEKKKMISWLLYFILHIMTYFNFFFLENIIYMYMYYIGLHINRVDIIFNILSLTWTCLDLKYMNKPFMYFKSRQVQSLYN
jgi:hypothetical protein